MGKDVSLPTQSPCRQRVPRGRQYQFCLLDTMVGLTGRKEELLPWLSALPLSPPVLDFSNKAPLVQGAQQ